MSNQRPGTPTADEGAVGSGQGLHTGPARKDLHSQPVVLMLQHILLCRCQRWRGRLPLSPHHLSSPPFCCRRSRSGSNSQVDTAALILFTCSDTTTCLNNVFVFDLHLLPRSFVATVGHAVKRKQFDDSASAGSVQCSSEEVVQLRSWF